MYKEPNLQDRLARSAEARQKALEKLKAKPALDPAIIAERQAAAAERQAALAEKRAAKKQAENEARQARAEAKLQAAAPVAAPREKPQLTEAEQKAARDLRYAQRKARK